MPDSFRLGVFAGMMIMLAACSTGSASAVSTDGSNGGRVVGDGQNFSMHPGEQVMLGDRSELRYAGVVNDSRCPPGVQCIWAGDAEVAFEWAPVHGAVQRFSLHTGKDPRNRALGERRLTLVALASDTAPEAQLRIDSAH